MLLVGTANRKKLGRLAKCGSVLTIQYKSPCSQGLFVIFQEEFDTVLKLCPRFSYQHILEKIS